MSAVKCKRGKIDYCRCRQLSEKRVLIGWAAEVLTHDRSVILIGLRIVWEFRLSIFTLNGRYLLATEQTKRFILAAVSSTSCFYCAPALWPVVLQTVRRTTQGCVELPAWKVQVTSRLSGVAKVEKNKVMDLYPLISAAADFTAPNGKSSGRASTQDLCHVL